MATKSINFKSEDNKSLSMSELKKRGAAAAALAAAIIGGSVAVGGCSDPQETAEAAEEPAADALAEDLAAEVAANEAAAREPQQPQAQAAQQPAPQAQTAEHPQPQHIAQHEAEANDADIPVDTDFLNGYANSNQGEHTDAPAPEQPAEPAAALQGIPAVPMTIFEHAQYTPVEISQVDFGGSPVTMAVTTDPNGETFYLADLDDNGTFETVLDSDLNPVAQLNLPGSDDLFAVNKVQEIIDYNNSLLNGEDKELVAENTVAEEQSAEPAAGEQPGNESWPEPTGEQPAVAELQGIPAAPMTIFENAKYTPVEINQVDFDGTPVTMAITTDPNGDTYYLADMDGNGTFETVFDANLSPVAQLNIPGSDDLLAVSKVQEIIDYNSGLLNGQDKEFMAQQLEEADEHPAEEPLVAQNADEHPADEHPADQDDDVIEIEDDTITDEVLVENVSGEQGSVVSFLHNLVFGTDDDVAQSEVMIEENEEFIDEPDDADDVTDEPIVDEPVE